MLVGEVLVVREESRGQVEARARGLSSISRVLQVVVYNECEGFSRRGYPANKNDSKEGRTWHKREESITQIRRSYRSMRRETKDGQARGPWSDKY
jgi:hypothetical protein